MRTEKVSLSLPRELLEEARALVPDGNLSAYIAAGLARQVRADRLTQLLCELDQELGPLTAEEIEAARREWHNEA